MRNACRAAAAACRKHERGIVTFFGVMIIAALGFVVGMMTQSTLYQQPMVISYDAALAEDDDAQITAARESAIAGEQATDNAQESESITDATTCQFVGSRNSTKYYPPTCSFARRIAPENLRCFVSQQDAESQGYVRSTGC